MSDAGLSTADKDARIAELEAALAAAHADISARDILIDTLRVQIARLKRMQFGKSSEKLDTQIAQLELALEELEGEAIVAAARRADPAEVDRPSPVRSLPAHLPREEQRIEPEKGNCACPDCGGALRPLGQDSDEMLDAVPVQWRVVRTIRPKYSCRSCEKIVQAPAPVKAIARGKATFGTLAHVVVSKFDHHLPLYRQAEIMAAQGIEIDRSMLAGWVGQASVLLDPIVSRIREVGLTALKIHTDDTPVPMLDPGRGKTATGRLWAYAVDDRGSGATTPALVWYEFTTDRTGVHPQRQLASFTGYLQADGYAGYDKLYDTNRVTEVACWAHYPEHGFIWSVLGYNPGLPDVSAHWAPDKSRDLAVGGRHARGRCCRYHCVPGRRSRTMSQRRSGGARDCCAARSIRAAAVHFDGTVAMRA